jgi:hypothetical protein
MDTTYKEIECNSQWRTAWSFSKPSSLRAAETEMRNSFSSSVVTSAWRRNRPGASRLRRRRRRPRRGWGAWHLSQPWYLFFFFGLQYNPTIFFWESIIPQLKNIWFGVMVRVHASMHCWFGGFWLNLLASFVFRFLAINFSLLLPIYNREGVYQIFTKKINNSDNGQQLTIANSNL